MANKRYDLTRDKVITNSNNDKKVPDFIKYTSEYDNICERCGIKINKIATSDYPDLCDKCAKWLEYYCSGKNPMRYLHTLMSERDMQRAVINNDEKEKTYPWFIVL